MSDQPQRAIFDGVQRKRSFAASGRRRLAALADELGIRRKLLYEWRHAYRKHGSPGYGLRGLRMGGRRPEGRQMRQDVSLSTTHLREAVHGKVYQQSGVCHGRWARYREECFSGSRRRLVGAVIVAKPVRRSHLLTFFASLPACLSALKRVRRPPLGRQLIALGHVVKLIPPAYVNYVGAARTTRSMRRDMRGGAATDDALYASGSVDNQAQLMRHRTRELLEGNRTRMLNALRGHLAEIGIVAPQGRNHAYALKRIARRIRR